MHSLGKACRQNLPIDFGGRRKFAMRRIAADALSASRTFGHDSSGKSHRAHTVDHGQEHGAFWF